MTEEVKRLLSAEDLYRLQLVSDCQLAPDGRHVVFCVERVDKKSEKKFTNLWLAPADGSGERQLTFGDQSDSKPKWSPDGSQIAFLSNRDDEDQSQIFLLPLSGGEARPLTDVKGEFDSLAWSPDGRRLLCQFRKKDQMAIERDEDEDKKKLGIVARHFTRVFIKSDGDGYLPEERWHIWTFDAETGQGRQLTDGATYDELSPCWLPDGDRIAFLSNRAVDPDLDPYAIDLFIMPAAGGEDWCKIETQIGDKYQLGCSPDGHWLSYLGNDGRGNWWRNENLWIVPTNGDGAGSTSARNLTADHDVYVGNATLGDVADRPTVAPVWSRDSERLFFQLSRHGNTFLYSLSVDGADLRPIIDVEGVVGTFSTDQSSAKFACVQGNRSDPGQIYLTDLEEEGVRQLTQFNGSLMDEVELGEVEEVWFKGSDANDLQGWIIKPPDFDPGQKYPSILEIHGGPFLQYGNLFMHEFQFLAAQGYVVYFCNPRGGQGYGEAHSKAIQNNWGTVDYEDLMAWVDLMSTKPYIDPERMGVAGGSYGGYMTTWIIGHTNRFKAAVAQRIVSNLVSMWATSDFNWDFQYAFGEKPPWEDMDNLWRQSPIAYISSAKTPTLVIHSEQDMRCDLEQGLQLYVSLKVLGVDSELLIFPGESHGLSRGGRTDRRVARLERMARWFDRYLKE